MIQQNPEPSRAPRARREVITTTTPRATRLTSRKKAKKNRRAKATTAKAGVTTAKTRLTTAAARGRAATGEGGHLPDGASALQRRARPGASRRRSESV